MKKRALILVLVLLMAASLAVPAFAQGNTLIMRVFDEAGVLGDEVGSLNFRADEVSKKCGMNVCLFISQNCNDLDIEEYSDYMYENLYSDTNGIAFVHNIDTKELYISTYGNAGLVITDEIMTKLFEAYQEPETYTESAELYLSTAEELLNCIIPEVWQDEGVSRTPDEDASEEEAPRREIPAERQLPRLVDNADIMSDKEEAKVLAKLDEISTELEFDVVVVTVNGLEGKTATEYADDFFDYNGYGWGLQKDGALLLLSMEDRDYAFSTHGYGETAFLLGARNAFEKEFMSKISKGNYEKGFINYAKQCKKFVEHAREKRPYDSDHLPVNYGYVWLISCILGFLIGFVVAKKQKDKLKSVEFMYGAADYTRPGSIYLTYSADNFVNSYLSSRTLRDDSSSSSDSSCDSGSHTSSSGESHGGWSGKF